MTHYETSLYYVELYFDSAPEESLRESLKICGWHWLKKKQCWSAKKTPENIELAKRICEDRNKPEKDPLLDKPRYQVCADSLVVRSNSFYCHLHHVVEDVAGLIPVSTKKGEVHNYLVPAAYCIDCDVFYILEETYKELKKKGVILCMIKAYPEYIRSGKGFSVTSQWREASPLRLWGYSVSEEEGLTEEQRRIILEQIIDNRIMPKDRVLSYLDFFLRLHSDRSGNAAYKWKCDRNYIAEYKLGSSSVVYFPGFLMLHY